MFVMLEQHDVVNVKVDKDKCNKSAVNPFNCEICCVMAGGVRAPS